jgi:hypothetical protein
MICVDFSPTWALRSAYEAAIMFIKPGVEQLINLQREGSKAKPYQVRQVRSVILRYRLGGNDDA